MRSASVALSMCALLSVCVICSAHSTSAQQPTRTPAERWQLTFHLSGGFAGFDRELQLTSSGAATAIDQRRPRQVSRQVAPGELLEIDRLVGSAVSLDAARPTQCRDCLTYAIQLQAAGRQISIRVGDDTLSGTSAAALVRALTRLQGRLLADP